MTQITNPSLGIENQTKSDQSIKKDVEQPELDVSGDMLERKSSMLPFSVDSNEKQEGKESTKFHYSGLIYGVLASTSFSSALFISKILAKQNYHPLNIAIWRIQGLVFFGPLIIYFSQKQKKSDIFKPIWPLNSTTLKAALFLFLSGAFTAATTILQVTSLKYLSQSDAVTVAYSTPIAVGILARIFLGEPFGIVSLLLGVFAFLGVSVVARPPLLTGQKAFDTENLIGVAFAFTAMLTLSTMYVITRKLKDVHFSICLTATGYGSTLVSITLALGFQVLDIPHSLNDWLLAGGCASLSFVGHICIIKALQAEFAGLVALVRTGDVVFAFLWQMIISIYPDSFSLVGAAIVVSTIAFSAFIKWLNSLPEEDYKRKRLWFLLK